MPPEQKVLTKLQNIFSHFRVSLTAAGFAIDASGGLGFDPVDQIFGALKNLAQLAKQQGKKIIFFMRVLDPLLAYALKKYNDA